MEFLPATIWAIGLVFARIGALLMLAPGIGDTFVPARVRLLVALFVAGTIAPMVAGQMPPLPEAPGAMAGIIAIEVLIGLALGLTTRMLMAALATAGTIVGMQTGMAMAMAFDPTQGTQGAVFGTFLALLGTTLVFQTDAHHWFLTGALATFQTLPPGAPFPTGQIADWVIKAFTQGFSIALQMTAPLIVFGIVINAALGIINRIAPVVQVFFIAQPVQIMLGLVLFLITAGGGMLVWLDAIVAAGRDLN
jgi:flagellar biosynthesis protein FliR